MRLKISLYKKLKDAIYQIRYYTSINDLPIENWFKIHEIGYTESKYLVKHDFYFKVCFVLGALPFSYYSIWAGLVYLLIGSLIFIRDRWIKEEVWEDIYDEFVREIGINKEYKDYLKSVTRIALMRCEYVINPSPIAKAELNLKLAEIESRDKPEKVKYQKIIAAASKSQGYRINPKKVTVSEFYSYLDGK